MSVLIIFILNYSQPGQAFFDIFFSDRSDTGMDFFNPVIYASGGLRNMFTSMDGITYPALAVVLFRFLYKSLPSSILIECNNDITILRGNQFLLMQYVICILITVVCTTILIQKIMLKSNGKDILPTFPPLICLSYGMVYGIERGNIVIFMPMLIFFFLYYKDDSRWYMRELALLGLATAAGLKIYPAFWGILLIQEKRIWDSLRTIIYGAIFLVGPMIYYGGINSIIKWIYNLTGFNTIAGNISDLSGCGAVQLSRTFCYILNLDSDISANIYSFAGKMQIVVCFLLITSIFVLKRNWEKYLAIVFLMIFFPRWSNDYCYMYFSIPFLYLICDKKTDRESSVYYVMLSLVTLIYLLPKFINFYDQKYAFEISDLVRQIAVVCMFIALCFYTIKQIITSIYHHKFNFITNHTNLE